MFCFSFTKHHVGVSNDKQLYLQAYKLKYIITLGSVIHDTGATFARERVHFGSLSWVYICLHDTTTKCHAGTSHPGVSSPRFLYWGKNFTPVRNLAMVSCKRETTTRFSVKWVCQLTGTGSACVMFAILNHTCMYFIHMKCTFK